MPLALPSLPLLQVAAAGAQRLELVQLQADVLQQCGEVMGGLAQEQRRQVAEQQRAAQAALQRAEEEAEQSSETIAGGQPSLLLLPRAAGAHAPWEPAAPAQSAQLHSPAAPPPTRDHAPRTHRPPAPAGMESRLAARRKALQEAQADADAKVAAATAPAAAERAALAERHSELEAQLEELRALLAAKEAEVAASGEALAGADARWARLAGPAGRQAAGAAEAAWLLLHSGAVLTTPSGRPLAAERATRPDTCTALAAYT